MTLAALAAAVISIIALMYSNYFAFKSSQDSATGAKAQTDAANATLSQVRLERAPILTGNGGRRPNRSPVAATRPVGPQRSTARARHPETLAIFLKN
jgi:hypothetical protein